LTSFALTHIFMKPICYLCGTRHESYQAHVFASNKVSASNNASNRVVAEPLANAGAVGAVEGRVRPCSGRRISAVGEGEGVGSKQRWGREAYNAYQREYMRRRRALGRGD
jgi:hypothetical protein